MSKHTHQFAHWPFAAAVNTASICTAKVARDRFPVLQVSHDWEGDWQFLDATTEEPQEPMVLCLGCVFERDQTLAQIAELPIGWSAWRTAVGAPWSKEQNPPESEHEDA
jgi:hypothetical protein